MRGFIKMVEPNRGFGFIRDATGTDFFFHATSVRGVRFAELTEGTAVEFATDPLATGRRPRAVDVTVAAV
jgi:cold shock CspA family protein